MAVLRPMIRQEEAEVDVEQIDDSEAGVGEKATVVRTHSGSRSWQDGREG